LPLQQKSPQLDTSINELAAKRPAGITLLSFFFVFGAISSGLAAFILLLPGTPLDALWRLNPRAREGFAPLGFWALFLMSVVCVACARAALGLWNRRRWGYWTAISILGINLLSDIINAFALRDWRTLIGLPIAGFLIAYLLRKRTVFSGAGSYR
jgi:hypothetical protein